MLRTMKILTAILIVAPLITLVTSASAQRVVNYGMASTGGTILDPHVTSARDDRMFLSMMFDSLTFVTPDFQVLPWLAEEIDSNEDATVFHIRLREGVTFHDGTALDAEAVKFNFDRIVAPATGSAMAIWGLPGYIGTEVVDARTVRVEFSEPNSGFPFRLAGVAGQVQSPTAISAAGDRYHEAPVGTGPFMFGEYVANQYLSIVRNPDYDWAYPGAGHSGPPMIDEVRYHFIPEDSARAIAFETGAVDIINWTPVHNVDRYAADPNIELITMTNPGTGVIVMVNSERSPTDDPAIRKALQLITDQQGLVDIAWFGHFRPHEGAVMASAQPSYVDVHEMYPYDPEQAIQVLEDAGWELGPDGVRVKDGQPARLVFLGFPIEDRVRAMEVMQSEAWNIGIDVEISLGRGPSYNRRRQAGEMNMIMMQYTSDEDVLRGMYHSSEIDTGYNFIRWRGDEVDALIERAEQTLDFDEQMLAYAELQRFLAEEALVIPIAESVEITAHRSHIEGLGLISAPRGPAANFYEVQVIDD